MEKQCVFNTDSTKWFPPSVATHEVTATDWLILMYSKEVLEGFETVKSIQDYVIGHCRREANNDGFEHYLAANMVGEAKRKQEAGVKMVMVLNIHKMQAK